MKNGEYIEDNYRVIVTSKGKEFHLQIPELGLQVHDYDLTQAYRKIMAEKKAHFERYTNAGMEKEIPLPVYSWSAKDSVRLSAGSPDMVSMFTLITLIVLLIVSCLGFFTVYNNMKAVNSTFSCLHPLVAKIDASVSEPSRAILFIRSLIYQAAEGIEKLPAKKKENLRKELRILVRDLKPLVDEIRPLFEDNKNRSSGSQPPDKR